MATPAFVAVATPASASFSATISVTLNAGAGANRFVSCLIFSSLAGATTYDIATYAGAPMVATTAHFSSASGSVVRAFHLAGAASGPNTLTVTLSDANFAFIGLLAIAYAGVDGAAPVAGAATQAGAFNATPTASIGSVAADEKVVFLIGSIGATTNPNLAPSSPAVERQDALIVSNSHSYIMDEEGTGTVVIDGTLTETDEWFGAAFRLKAIAAAAGGAGTPGGFIVDVGSMLARR